MENFDRALALERAGGDLDLARQMHAMLSRELISLGRIIDANYTSGEFDAMLEHVHKLHGATRYCGVPALEARCRDLEKALRAADHADLEKLISGLRQAMTDLSATPPPSWDE